MKKIKPNKLQLTRITLLSRANGGRYMTLGTGCGISYAAWCSESCNSCADLCGTAMYSACDFQDCL